MSVKVLITGGAGYIGSELVGRLLNDDTEHYQVHVVDNLMYGGHSLLRYATNPNFSFTNMDVRSEKLRKHVREADVIIPLAALVGFPLCDRQPAEAVQINFEVNEQIADWKRPNQKLIYPCTNSGYGLAKDGVCTEESPLNPVSLYGKTKVWAEEEYHNTEGCTTLRLATVFGPSSRARSDLLVNNFVWKALKDRVLVLYECEFMRNYVHIQDVVESFMFVLDNWDKCKNETFNVGNDAVNMNKLQLAEKIAEHIPVEIIKAEFTKDPDVRNYIVSSKKIYDLGFKCRYDLDTGIKQLLTQYSLIDEPWNANY